MNHGIIHCVNLDKNFQFLSVFASFANKTFARVNCAFSLRRDILMLCNPLKSNSYMFADCQFYFVKILKKSNIYRCNVHMLWPDFRVYQGDQSNALCGTITS